MYQTLQIATPARRFLFGRQGPLPAPSPSLGFHPMAPSGGKESTQRCHWEETRLPLDAPGGARRVALAGRVPGWGINLALKLVA